MKTTAPSLPAPVGNGSDKREKSGDLANDELDVILQEIEELDSKRGKEGSKLLQAFENQDRGEWADSAAGTQLGAGLRSEGAMVSGTRPPD